MWAGLAVYPTGRGRSSPARRRSAGPRSGLAGIAAFAALAIISREVLGAGPPAPIERIQADAAHAINTDDAAAAKRAISQLRSLYACRADAQLGLTACRNTTPISWMAATGCNWPSAIWWHPAG